MMEKPMREHTHTPTDPVIPASILTRIARNATPIREGDRAILSRQLGRYPRGLVGIGARCVCSRPAVTITYPRLPSGEPFPTLFYLSLPWLVKKISHIESIGGMESMNARLNKSSESYDPDLAHNHEQAHRSYIERRNILADVPQLAGRSAGGMPDRVKCLHALAGYALAVGSGVTAIGDEALRLAGWNPEVCHCSA